MSKVIAYKVIHDSENIVNLRLMLDNGYIIEVRANKISCQYINDGVSRHYYKAKDIKAYIKNYKYKLLK